MAVGIDPSKSEIDNQAGVIARDLDSATDRALEFKEYLDAHLDDHFVAKGYTPDEVAVLRSAFSDASKLALIFRGLASDPNLYDYRTFLKQIWGFGSI